jgi:hypothetical protein
MNLVSLHLACNSHRNGAPLTHASALEVRGVRLDLPPARWGDDGKVLRLGRLRVRHHGHTAWVGNWCFDAWLVDEAAALTVLEWARKGGAAIEEAPEEFWDAWESGEPLKLSAEGE